SKALAKARETKTREEISKIQKAVKISEKAINSLPRYFRRGMTEKQLALKLESILRAQGDNELAFPSIVASAKNSAIPHHVTSNTKIRNGLLLIDFGAKYKNYCADLTRVFCVGRATKQQKELYEKVYSAKEFAQELCKPNAKCEEIFSETSKLLKRTTRKPLMHGLGHGLGLQVHDFPSGFLEKSKDVLRESMVLTVEPGIYGKFGGIRIEDDALITRNGAKLLSRAPRKMIEL
ncbi:MAG: M24 family metallopeptidase, partial [Candidatus Diapherotrites archaeon]|nr:M24 family metallopeptidase [Candidatus Diapherotrites archaeon]